MTVEDDRRAFFHAWKDDIESGDWDGCKFCQDWLLTTVDVALGLDLEKTSNAVWRSYTERMADFHKEYKDLNKPWMKTANEDEQVKITGEYWENIYTIYFKKFLDNELIH